MGKNSISPDNRSQRDLLRDLLAAMGVADANSFQYLGLETVLSEIESAWLARREMPNCKELRRFRAITAKRRELRKQFPPAVREAIELAGWRRAYPDVHERFARAAMQNNRPGIDHAKIEEEEDRNIELVIDRAGDYRKRQVRKLAVEPFLLLLKEYHVVPHPKRLPLSRMMQAFFDWLGVEQTLRPTDS